MTKTDLVKKIVAKFNLSTNLTNKLVQSFFEEILTGLVKDSRTELRRFGVFAVKRQKSRTITLPSGEKITRPAKNILIFKPSPSVKKRINQPSKKPLPRRWKSI